MMIEQPIVKLLSNSYQVLPSDFLLGEPRPIFGLPDNATPYCADFSNKFLMCVTSPEILDYPFLYQAQRLYAQTVVKIPFSDLPNENLMPTLIFSPGRCGSTLLLKILQAMGLPSVSEPAYFSQIVGMFAQDTSQPGEPYHRVLRAASVLLARKLGSKNPVIKLRFECNAAPLLITHAFSSVKVIFIVRDFRSWAISFKRINASLTAHYLVAYFNQALSALYLLSKFHGARICRYQDFSRPDTKYVADILSFLGCERDIPDEALEAVLSRDSQEGTNVSRSNLAKRPIDPAFLEEIDALWKIERPAALIDELELSDMI